MMILNKKISISLGVPFKKAEIKVLL